MMQILTIGDPRLEQRAEAIPPTAEELAGLHRTLSAFRLAKGFGRAIAAPQVGIAKRCIAVNLGAGPISILNPEFLRKSEEMFEVWDDCLSIPDWIVRVRRHVSISLRYQDELGREREWRNLPRDLSELLQHEIDHLDGILMTRRATGIDAIRPIEEHAALVGSARPKSRLSLDKIAEAAKTINPVFRNSPQWDLELAGSSVRLKIETVNPIRCFKGRGADFFLQQAASNDPIVCASAGNWGQALAYAGAKRNRRVVVYASTNVNPLKLERMRAIGAEVRLTGHDFDAAKAEARKQDGFVEDGREASITEGAGSIAVELLADNPVLDTVLLSLGNGALLNGCARWIKAASPATKVVGVCASGADSMRQSFLEGRVVDRADVRTIADGIAVRTPVPEAVEDMRGLVDDVVLVDDQALVRAMRLLYRETGLLVEPSGAAGVAAILSGNFSGQRLATVLCGGNLTDEQVRNWILPNGDKQA